MERFLGLDLGSKTLGVSISDTTNVIASLYKTIRFKEDDYDYAISELESIILNNEITTIILGLPKNMNNTIGERAELTLKFKEKLEKKFNINVIMEDERLTSVISNNVLIKSDISRNKRKKKVDGMAAIIILQSYLDRRNKNG